MDQIVNIPDFDLTPQGLVVNAKNIPINIKCGSSYTKLTTTPAADFGRDGDVVDKVPGDGICYRYQKFSGTWTLLFTLISSGSGLFAYYFGTADPGSFGNNGDRYDKIGETTVDVYQKIGGAWILLYTINATPAITAPAFTTDILQAWVANAGDPISLPAVAASGTPAPTYQWQIDTGSGWEDIVGAATDTLTTEALAEWDGASLRCVATNVVAAVPSSECTLTVTSLPAGTIILNQFLNGALWGVITLQADYAGGYRVINWETSVYASGALQIAITNDAVWNTLTYVSGNALPYTADYGTPYKYEFGAMYSGVQRVTDSATYALDVGPINQSSAPWAAYFSADQLTWDLPLITTQPANAASATPTYSVVANGPGTLAYQWQRQAGGSGGWADLTEAGVYSGVETDELSISDATGLYGDNYRVVVSNENGEVNSDAASLSEAPSYAASVTFTTYLWGGGDPRTVILTAVGSSGDVDWACNFPGGYALMKLDGGAASTISNVSGYDVVSSGDAANGIYYFASGGSGRFHWSGAPGGLQVNGSNLDAYCTNANYGNTYTEGAGTPEAYPFTSAPYHLSVL